MKSLMPWFCLAATVQAQVVFAADGVDAYREGYYTKAAQLLGKATDPSPTISYYMARMNLYGYGELKNNTVALRYFTRAAEKGFLPAQQFMAEYYLLKENNLEQALYWFKKAANANDLQAQMYCAAAYLFGIGTKKNTDIAKRYYIAAAKSGDSIAQYELAKEFVDSRHPENKKLGLLWLNKSVAQNNPEAQLKLGELYALGGLVPRDLDKAKELIGLSVAQGSKSAMYQMGELFRLQSDWVQAKDWYTKAANANYSLAMIALSQLYMQSKAPFYDPPTGFLWMLKAAQSGSSEAQRQLALLYKNGQGVNVDANLAAEWQHKSVESAKDSEASSIKKAALWLSNNKADTFVASGYRLKGILGTWRNQDALKENNYNPAPEMEVVTRDTLYQPRFVVAKPNEVPISEYYNALASSLNRVSNKAVAFPRYPLNQQLVDLEKDNVQANVAADSKNAVSLSKVSASKDGLGFVVTSAKQKERYQTIIENLNGRAVLGDNDAQFDLGQIHQFGVGMNEDVAGAIKYYEEAAAQQDLRAEYYLGLLYLEGHGVTADYPKAIDLLRDAAFKGNDEAQFALATIYEQGYRNGEGAEVIKADHEQAVAMYYLSSASGYGPAQYRLAEMLVHEKQADLSMQARQKRNQLIKQLYEEAFSAGVGKAALPLAFFYAMEKDKNKQAQALTLATNEAHSGNAEAALLLGILSDRGIGLPENQEEALGWYQKAPQNPVTNFILGTYYGQGIGVSEDKEKGKAMLQQAADGGFAYANLNLAIMHQKAGEAFLPELNKALDAGNSRAGILLADYYLSEGNNEQNMQQARDIYQSLADKGDKQGQLKLGYLYELGLGGPVDTIAAGKWYGLAAEQGQPIAQFLLGHLYQLGLLGKEPDYAAAKEWYAKAEKNFAPAAIALGFIYDTVDDDYKKALDAYQIASATHDPIGDFNTGLIFEKGKGEAVQAEEAKKYYSEAAELGHPKAMVQLAGLYFNGLLGQRDEDQALIWYKKAADLGDKDALYQLGLLSETGVGVKLDFANAKRYYEQSASKGNAKASLALARMYQYGLGVSQNYSEAFKLYKTLADEGNAYALYRLAMFYYDGVAGEHSPDHAKILLREAEANGNPQASRVLQWLAAQAQERSSFIEPAQLSKEPSLAERPVDLMYMDALNEWNRGDENSSRMILDKIRTEFPHYIPAQRAYEQLNQHTTSGIFG